MAKYIKYKVGDYTVIDNYMCRDKSLSLKAKGLLTMMLSLPNDWKYSIAGLTTLCREGEKSITTALAELQEQGYVVISKEYPTGDNGGRIEYVYSIYEIPKHLYEIQDPQKQGLEIQGLENGGLYKNIDNKNTNNKNNISREDNIDYGLYVDTFNHTCVSLPSVNRLTDKRKKKLKARLKSFTEAEILSAFVITEQSDFLTGRRGQWKANFDWIIQSDDNLLKILEGNYANTMQAKNLTREERLRRAYEEIERKILNERNSTIT